MPKESAGLLLYRRTPDLRFLLVHPGGPFWKHRDLGSWSIPKGEIDSGEDPLAAALREFQEELGFRPSGPFLPLTPIRQKGGKVVHAWAVEGDWRGPLPTHSIVRLEFPARSGKWIEFPEIDKAEWWSPLEGRDRLLASQLPLLAQAEAMVTADPCAQGED